jgi:uncharacterized membrane protein YraQ (UPF0718 family)
VTASAQISPAAEPSARHRVAVGLGGVLVAAMLLALGLAWAKWLPYAHKATGLFSSHTWPGTVAFAESGAPGAAPTFAGAWRFTTSYFTEVWAGFTVSLTAAAAIDALVPRAWLLRVLQRRGRFGQALAGGAASLPSLMCTCCTAPLAVGLRRRGVGTAAGLAYWVGNPVLNPAVLLFLFLVAPWQFGVVRLVVGAGLVFGASALVARLFAPGPDAGHDEGYDGGRDGGAVDERLHREPEPADPVRFREFPRRFVRSLVRLALVLLPAYFAMVLVVGWLSGWLSAFSGLDARVGLLAVLACAVIGSLLVIPTGGEIPVVLALSTVGVAAGSAGALLITLPALSIPSMAMVGPAFSWRVTAAMAGAVVVAGLVSAALLWALL